MLVDERIAFRGSVCYTLETRLKSIGLSAGYKGKEKASNSFKSLAFSFGPGERILSYTLSMIPAALCMLPFTSWPYTPKASMLSLLKRCTIYDSSKRIVRRDTESFYKVFSRESTTVHGLNPSFVICDELYEAKNRVLFGVLKTGMGTRTEPLFVTLRNELVL